MDKASSLERNWPGRLVAITKTDQMLAWRDIVRGSKLWPIAVLIGRTEIAARYRRTKVGQFWITISLAITIAALGFVWSYLWGLPIREFLPFIAVSHILWTFIASMIVDGPSVFITAGPYLREMNVPKSVFLASIFVRNLVILAHNIVILPIVFLIFSHPISWELLLYIPAFLLVSLTLVGFTTFLSVVGLRFRDVSSMVMAVMHIAFFVTPVIWYPSNLPDDQRFLLLLNPFSVMLELLREPLMGRIAAIEFWVVGLGLCLFSVSMGAVVFIKFRRRLTYWL